VDLIARTASWLTDAVHWGGANGIPARLVEHVGLSAVSLAIALAIGLPLGLWIGHTGRFTWLAVNSANLWRALPSLAVIAIVLPITAPLDPQAGFKIYPTVVAMVVLAVPPILVNAHAGVAGIERDLVEAGRGQGLSERQILTRVELPLAVPVVVTGIRSGTIQIIATATLGAIFGFGGLGRYLVDGFAQFSRGGDAQMLAGAILVAALVIATELLFAALQRLLTPRAMRLERSEEAARA
jgi:osmoprotectant transport system permease protein